MLISVLFFYVIIIKIEVIMEDIKTLINEWLEEWHECSMCNIMHKPKELKVTNEDVLLCEECEWDLP